MPVSEAIYERVALEDPEGRWELHFGQLRSKPAMSQPHNTLQDWLSHLLWGVLDERQFEVRTAGRAKKDEANNYIADLMIVPIADWRRFQNRAGLEQYPDPLPLVVEVWSPSTGGYDVDAKIPDYRRCGDAEIWRLHPYDRTLTAWRRQPDGSYTESSFTAGVVALHAIPGSSVDLDRLFATLDR